MPPRKGPRNVVKSGNAGNSSKSSPLPTTQTAPAGVKAVDTVLGGEASRPPPLFPVGYKSPLTILNEKCQKEGWERPVVDLIPNKGTNPPTYSAAVTLRKRKNKNALDLETVRLVPVPRIEAGDAGMARHLGATYALFRFCSTLPMAMILPPSIRPYWSQLLSEKAQAPPHRAWEYSADPFAAKREVEKRQAVRVSGAKQRALAAGAGGAGAGGDGKNGKDGWDDGFAANARKLDSGGGANGAGGGGGRGWNNVPEVKMSQNQREVVEGVIRSMMSKYPSAILAGTRESAGDDSATPGGSTGASTPNGGARSGGGPGEGIDVNHITRQLLDLGFRPAHVTSCVSAVQASHQRLMGSSGSGSGTPAGGARDPLTLSLAFLSPLEAAIEWLLVHLPEDDLPVRYRPSGSGAGADFVSGVKGAGEGQEGLVRGWVVDKCVKKAGFPRAAVERVVDELLKVESTVTDAQVLDLLGRRLCGWEKEEDGWGVDEYDAWTGDADEEEEREVVRLEEKTILGSVLGAERYTETSPTEFSVSVTSADDEDDLALHIIFSSASPYPSSRFPCNPPSFYLTSSSLPAYIRLHLHAAVLRAFRDPERPDLRSLLEQGAGGAVYAMLEILEEQLPLAVEQPPDVVAVMRYLVPAPEDERVEERAGQARGKKREQRKGRRREPTAADQEAVRQRRQAMWARPGWEVMLKSRMKLPAWTERERIMSLLESNRVLIVVGETGCGKSTQLPQFILDHEIDAGRGAQTRIVVTQPRRVSALGLASRVADERMEDLDQGAQSVGYIIRGESKTGPNTQISFVTTGVILRRLSAGGDADLDGISHIVVDEVHERSVDSDFLLLQLRELLQRNKSLKVLLMSATINQKTFIDYFGGAPALEIPGFTYPVQDLYMEDYISALSYRPEPARFKIRQSEEQKKSLRDSLEKLDIDDNARQALEVLSTSQQIPYDLVASICRYIDKTSPKKDEGILIFMPGVAEIKTTVDAIKSQHLHDCAILPLHANLSNTEQKQVFAKINGRKIVVATNVAETSITIPEIVYVIDCGKVKETQYDPDTSMSKLVETYTSRAASKQRRGRAGRVKPGVCYKLFTRRVEEHYMARFAIPEILRTPLESLFLQVKSMDQSTDVKSYLLKAIDPPKIEAIDSAWKTLLDLGSVEGEAMTSHLTALGRHMAALPVDLRLAKMLVLGCVFRALDPVLTIAAMLSSKPLFSGPMEKRDEMKRAKQRFAWGKSDILLNLRAFDATRDIKGYSALRGFCEESFINASTVRDINSLRQEFLGSLSELGYVPSNKRDLAALNTNSDNENLLKAILTGAFYPRVAMIRPPDARFEKIQAGSLVKEHEAKEVKFFDEHGRVFIHPASILFSEPNLKLGYLTYFHKAETSKPFLFDATEIPLFALLLFGGTVTVNHFAGGLAVGKNGHIRLKAWARIGVLVNQVRRLLDAKLDEAIESVEMRGGVDVGPDVVKAILTLLA